MKAHEHDEDISYQELNPSYHVSGGYHEIDIRECILAVWP